MYVCMYIYLYTSLDVVLIENNTILSEMVYIGGADLVRAKAYVVKSFKSNRNHMNKRRRKRDRER